jgi:pantothenate kinase-related protein Tda10
MSKIKELVQQFMTAYDEAVQRDGLPAGNEFANNYLIKMSKDMTEEEAQAFTEAAKRPLNAYLQTAMNAEDKRLQELSEVMTDA